MKSSSNLPLQNSRHAMQLLRNQISRHSLTPFRIRYPTHPAGKCWHLIALDKPRSSPKDSALRQFKIILYL